MPTARSRIHLPVAGVSPLFASAALRDADAEATRRFGIPSIVLMERAGLESARAILERYPDAGQAVILLGSGNNAGDGMVVARHLAEASWRVQVVSGDGRAPTTPDAHLVSNVALSLGVALGPFDPGALRPEGAVLVDAMLGTGTAGAPRAPLDAMIGWAADWPGPVVALDVPTGVDGDSGRVGGACIRADLTVTYHGDKPGLRVHPGRAQAGEVQVLDIGIPSAVRATPIAWLAAAEAAAAIPAKAAAGEKYSAGSVLVVAGAPGLTGAGVMCAQAALRAGAGLVVAAVPATVQPLMAPMMREVMCAPVEDVNGCLGPASVTRILAEAGRTRAIALGPGIGRDPATAEAVVAVLSRAGQPVVLDADGLWHVTGRLDVLGARTAPTVLTPHSGEAARLLGCSREEVDDDRLAAALQLCHDTGSVVVLKGPGTIVCGPAGEVFVARDGGPELSTAGSGDVLTGIVACALAKGMTPVIAAIAAVCAHAAAGARAGYGDGTVAGDLILSVPGAIQAARARVDAAAR